MGCRAEEPLILLESEGLLQAGMGQCEDAGEQEQGVAAGPGVPRLQEAAETAMSVAATTAF